jgi:nicotinamide-nucleotide amidase
VSEAVVKAMAMGALERAAVDIAVAVSGVAGPTGASEAKPVGTVWLAWAWRAAGSVQTHALPMWFAGDREAVRWQAVISALNGLLETLARLPAE